MIWFLGEVARATLIALVCPHCGERQARARKPEGERYRCRTCHRLFTRAEGEKPPAREGKKKPR